MYIINGAEATEPALRFSIENFFGMLKTEWIQRRKLVNIDEAKKTVEQYIHTTNMNGVNSKQN